MGYKMTRHELEDADALSADLIVRFVMLFGTFDSQSPFIGLA
jgi:hypothetical protein